jgi:predicted RNase H-like nuclease (RuvC/YqgF family)
MKTKKQKEIEKLEKRIASNEDRIKIIEARLQEIRDMEKYVIKNLN